MSDRKTIWLAPIGILIILSFLVPFTLLRNVDEWYGSFLFWVLATVAVIGISAVISSDWED